MSSCVVQRWYWIYFGTGRISKFHVVQSTVAKAAYVQRGPKETGYQIVWADVQSDVWQSYCWVGPYVLLAVCFPEWLSPVVLQHCTVQFRAPCCNRPREVGTNPEKDHKDAKGIRMNDLWWGKVKRTKCLEPLSLLHGHRNSNGVSCASTEESWIKSLSFYIPIKVTRAKQNGCSSLWTLCKKHLAVLLKVQDVVSHCQGTLWLFKNQHRISMRLAKSQRPEKESTCSGMAGVTLAVIFDLSWCSGLFLSSMHLHPTRTRYVLLPAGREQEGPQL